MHLQAQCRDLISSLCRNRRAVRQHQLRHQFLLYLLKALCSLTMLTAPLRPVPSRWSLACLMVLACVLTSDRRLPGMVVSQRMIMLNGGRVKMTMTLMLRLLREQLMTRLSLEVQFAILLLFCYYYYYYYS